MKNFVRVVALAFALFCGCSAISVDIDWNTDTLLTTSYGLVGVQTPGDVGRLYIVYYNEDFKSFKLGEPLISNTKASGFGKRVSAGSTYFVVVRDSVDTPSELDIFRVQDTLGSNTVRVTVFPFITLQATNVGVRAFYYDTTNGNVTKSCLVANTTDCTVFSAYTTVGCSLGDISVDINDNFLLTSCTLPYHVASSVCTIPIPNGDLALLCPGSKRSVGDAVDLEDVAYVDFKADDAAAAAAAAAAKAHVQDNKDAYLAFIEAVRAETNLAEAHDHRSSAADLITSLNNAQPTKAELHGWLREQHRTLRAHVRHDRTRTALTPLQSTALYLHEHLTTDELSSMYTSLSSGETVQDHRANVNSLEDPTQFYHALSAARGPTQHAQASSFADLLHVMTRRAMYDELRQEVKRQGSNESTSSEASTETISGSDTETNTNSDTDPADATAQPTDAPTGGTDFPPSPEPTFLLPPEDPPLPSCETIHSCGDCQQAGCNWCGYSNLTFSCLPRNTTNATCPYVDTQCCTDFNGNCQACVSVIGSDLPYTAPYTCQYYLGSNTCGSRSNLFPKSFGNQTAPLLTQSSCSLAIMQSVMPRLLADAAVMSISSRVVDMATDPVVPSRYTYMSCTLLEATGAEFGFFGSCDASVAGSAWPCASSVYYLKALPQCGASLAISANYLAVGYPDVNQVAIVSTKNKNNVVILDGPTLIGAVDRFGDDLQFSVDAKGRATLMISAPGSLSAGIEGFAYFFTLNNLGRWQQAPLTVPNQNYQLTRGFNYEFRFRQVGDFALIMGLNAAENDFDFLVIQECLPGAQFFGGRCTPCPAGQYKEDKSFDSCSLCPVGTYNAKTGRQLRANCLNCPAQTACFAGSSFPGLPYSLNVTSGSTVTPQLAQTDPVQFEATFFMSAGIWIAVFFGVMVLVTVFVFFDSIHRIEHEKVRQAQRYAKSAVVNSRIPLYFPDKTYTSGAFSLATVFVVLSIVVYAILVYYSQFNQAANITLNTFKDIEDRDNFNLVDRSAFSVSVQLIGYGMVNKYASPCLNFSQDMVTTLVDGCLTANNVSCSLASTSFAVSYTSNNVSICTLSVSYPEGTQLAATASFSYTFNNPQFFVSRVLWTVNTGPGQKITGASSVNNGFEPPAGQTADGLIVRGKTTVQIGSTVNTVFDCRNTDYKTDLKNSLRVGTDQCQFAADSIKEVDLLGYVLNTQTTASYYDLDARGFTFNLQIIKSQYFKITKRGWVVNAGAVAIWVVLFSFGFIGLIQVIGEVVRVCRDLVMKRFGKGKKAGEHHPTEMELQQTPHDPPPKPLEESTSTA